MEWRDVLRTLGLIQGALLVALVVQIVLLRLLNTRRDRRDRPRREAFDAAIGSLARGEGEARAVVLALRRLGRSKAVGALAWAATQVRQDAWDGLVHALKRERWVAAVRRQAGSRRWWERREVARLLAVTAAEEDASPVIRFLRDAHPAVSIAIVPALERIAGDDLTSAVLERLPRLSPVMLAYHAWTMRRSRAQIAGPLRAALLAAEGPEAERLAEFGARLEDPSLRTCFLALADHSDPEVRARAARALARTPDPATTGALERLARDAAWQVRLQAVRSLGRIAAASSLEVLDAALHDEEHWVRLRAGGALLHLGAPGRAVLERSAAGGDPGASSVARLLLTLPPWTLGEVTA